MGTNYYLHEKPACECCGREYESLHIGKSSAGWCFTLHVIPEEGINDLSDWQDRWSKPGARIVDEYGDEISTAAMYKKIADRSWVGQNDFFDYARNQAEPGPRGLVRHKIGSRCVGHGAGTWDLIPGEFS